MNQCVNYEFIKWWEFFMTDSLMMLIGLGSKKICLKLLVLLLWLKKIMMNGLYNQILWRFIRIGEMEEENRNYEEISEMAR